MNTYYKKEIVKDFYKAKFQYPKLEDIEVKKDYAFTIAPQLQRESVIEQCDCDNAIFNILNKYCNYKVYPELSTKNTSWHYHGRITFCNALQIANFYFYAIRQLKNLCTFTIIPIDDNDPIDSIQWYLYERKQRHNMYYLCHKNHQPYKVFTKLSAIIAS